MNANANVLNLTHDVTAAQQAHIHALEDLIGRHREGKDVSFAMAELYVQTILLVRRTNVPYGFVDLEPTAFRRYIENVKVLALALDLLSESPFLAPSQQIDAQNELLTLCMCGQALLQMVAVKNRSAGGLRHTDQVIRITLARAFYRAGDQRKANATLERIAFECKKLLDTNEQIDVWEYFGATLTTQSPVYSRTFWQGVWFRSRGRLLQLLNRRKCGDTLRA